MPKGETGGSSSAAASVSGQLPAPSRVIIYAHSWLPSQVDGVAVRMMAHVAELVGRGTEVWVVTPDFVDPDKPDAERKPLTKIEGVKEHIAMSSAWTPVYRKNMCMAFTIRNFLDILALVRRVKPDYVHGTVEASMQFWALACLLCDVPLICSFHTDITQIANRDAAFSFLGANLLGRLHTRAAVFFANWGYRNWSYCGAHYLAVSNQAKTCLRDAGVYDSKVAPGIWGPMVDRSMFCLDLPKDKVAAAREDLTFGIKDAFVMSYVGRVTAEKDIQFLVDAHKRAVKKGEQGGNGGRKPILVMVGPGSMCPELKKLHGKEHRIHCTGEFVSREEVALKLRASDCCVSASTMETVGFIAMEALSCGIPCLMARAQGFAEHLSHDVNARLWTPLDEASFDQELETLMATKREGKWSPEGLRESMESASVPYCTDRALRAYIYAGAGADNWGLRVVFGVFMTWLNWVFSLFIK
jgi:glycosyltransferase involved in cell wall biosynthesis